MLNKILKSFKPYILWTITCTIISYIELSIICEFESFTEVLTPTIMLGLLVGFIWDVYVNDLFDLGDKL